MRMRRPNVLIVLALPLLFIASCLIPDVRSNLCKDGTAIVDDGGVALDASGQLLLTDSCGRSALLGDLLDQLAAAQSTIGFLRSTVLTLAGELMCC